MFYVEQFKDLIVRPALHDLGMYSEDAVALLIFTCAAESNGGRYLKQTGGPALGIYQMEPDTHTDLWQNYIIKSNHSLLTIMINNFSCGRMPDEERLIYDLRYASAMTRIYYARVKAPLPKSDDVSALWRYYKHYYNTLNGKAEPAHAISAYQAFISS